ncbi:MAG TPA: helix-turn-helix domain-containing protein [Hyphomicrobiales bacterium]|nr:helix-turn-helix domain-containing protein [Hyphomicrobiales bacterium]
MGTFESQMIRRVLQQNSGSLKQTYEALGISRKTLYDKMQKYGIVADKEL